MQEISEVIKNKKLTTDTDSNRVNKFISTDTSLSIDTSSKNSGYWNDSLYSQIPDLVNEQYRGWYMKVFYQLGKDRVLGLIKEARQGNHPARYFSVLLKEAVKNG